MAFRFLYCQTRTTWALLTILPFLPRASNTFNQTPLCQSLTFLNLPIKEALRATETASSVIQPSACTQKKNMAQLRQSSLMNCMTLKPTDLAVCNAQILTSDQFGSFGNA